MSTPKKSTAVIFVLFGATGDLNSRKILPAIYNLFLNGSLSKTFAILATANQNVTTTEYKNRMKENLNKFSRTGPVLQYQWDEFAANISYLESDADDFEAYTKIREYIQGKNRLWKTSAEVLFYLAVSPTLFPVIATNIANAQLACDVAHSRILIEKPFGRDLKTAVELNGLLSDLFQERQIYRIDHYLGKPMAQNIMKFRFENSIMEPAWNNTCIERIEISVSEKLGVEQRGGYYDHSGALRDMVQNHLLQLLCLVAMEAPSASSADGIRDSKVEVLKAIRKLDDTNLQKSVTKGQYTAGTGTDAGVKGYREEYNVSPSSNTETFVALEFFIDNPRWQDVPFLLTTGKRMDQGLSAITVYFYKNFNEVFGFGFSSQERCRLTINIQPDMDIRLDCGDGRHANYFPTIEMDATLSKANMGQVPEAYENLILDAIQGNQSLFMRADQIELAWKTVMPILAYWQAQGNRGLIGYPAGTSAAKILEMANREKLKCISESDTGEEDMPLKIHQILESCFTQYDWHIC
ncbi:glucose-6-phosphate dehydrogenase [Pedobacter nototheniae]|uniref:glucose-6-phosphate dehydrogenase n=1 Tax=Pedobacter nototheniae TaxID=2488994 RepID=UPI0010389996|nr:glucose-6-phosphate dehydrogenase [Pedobacter nototheniae]